MSIQFEYEKAKDVPLKCFHCEHMKGKIGYKRITYQCAFNHCEIEEEKKKREKEKSNSSDVGRSDAVYTGAGSS